ncbi:UNVERIFIED_CONTAM: hypothetical protein Sindi_0714400, partial [Sesamum indicum]
MAEDPEILKLQLGDNPGLSLVTTLLDGSNFLSWMEPFSDSNKAYSMVLRVEKQSEVNSGQAYTTPNMAMQAFKKLDFSRNFQKRKVVVDKKSLICKHCGKSGHLKEGCFEIIGYPEWYKTFLDQKKTNTLTGNRIAVALKTEGERANSTMDDKSVTEL